MWVVAQRDPAGEWSIIRATVLERETAEHYARLYKDRNPRLRFRYAARMKSANRSTIANQ